MASQNIAALERCISAFARLPGVGRRSAERMVYFVATRDRNLAGEMAAALQTLKDSLRLCGRCGSLTQAEQDPCAVCCDETRSHLLCVVEKPEDVLRLEEAGTFRGRYHVLQSRLSPMSGETIAPGQLEALFQRLTAEAVEEVLLALGTDVERDATAQFLAEQLQARGVPVTRLAFGLPAGSGIEYSDSTTLTRAIKGRQKF